MADQSVLWVFAQQTLPRFDFMYGVMLLSRILHILGAIILVGGLFYLWAVVAPTTVEPGADTDRLFGGRRAAWAKWIGIATLLLLATGLLNYMQITKTHERMASSYHMIAGLKMVAGLALFFLAALLAGRSPGAESLRRRMGFWLNVCLVLGIVTVVFGSVLRSFPHNLKVDAPGSPVLIAPAANSPAE